MQSMIGRRQALALLGGIAMSIDADAAPDGLELRPTAVADPAALSSLALVPGASPQLVLAYDGPSGRRLVAMEHGGAALPVTQFRYPAMWSVAAAGAGDLQVSATDNGSAGTGLLWEGPHGRHARISRHERFGVFGAPAFMSPAQAAPGAVTAIALIDGQMRPVLFLPEAGDEFAPARPLPTPRPGECLAVKLLRFGPDLVQATLTFQPGSAPRRATSDPADGALQGGLLECQALTSDLRPDGPSWRPFGDETIWEFEVASSGGRPVFLASVAGGLALAAPPTAQAKPLDLQVRFASPLLSPALATIGLTLHVAALAGRGTPQASVLMGRIAMA